MGVVQGESFGIHSGLKTTTFHNRKFSIGMNASLDKSIQGGIANSWGGIIPECLPLATGPSMFQKHACHKCHMLLTESKMYLYTTSSVTLVFFFQAFPD